MPDRDETICARARGLTGDERASFLGGACGDDLALRREVEAGDVRAADRLLEAVYDELRALAAARLRRERPGQPLGATELVHEAYLRLVGGVDARFSSRGHFFGAAAEAMRRILIEQARRKLAKKHGAGADSRPLEHDPSAAEVESRNLLALHEALTTFDRVHPDKAALVKLRYFAGLSEEQAAGALGISRATAARHWAYARAWLYDEMVRLHRGRE